MIADELRALAERWPLTERVDRYDLRALADRVAEVERDAALGEAIRDRGIKEYPDGWSIELWVPGAPSLETIDDALKEQVDADR